MFLKLSFIQTEFTNVSVAEKTQAICNEQSYKDVVNSSQLFY